MPDALGGPSASTLSRWTTFIVVEANVAFIYAFVNRVGELPSITEVSQRYATTFVPARFVDAIYWVIGAAVLLFFVAALWPRRHPSGIYEPFIVPLAMASTLGSAWVVAFRYDQPDLVVALTAAGVVLGALMFARAAALRSPRSRLLRVPFSLIFGWATVALLITTAQWFNARGWLTTIELVTEMSLGFLALAAVLAAFVALRYREFVYPMVIAWAMGGIYMGQRLFDPAIASAALDACIGLLIVAGFAAVAAAIEPIRRKEEPSASRKAEKRDLAKPVAPAAQWRPAHATRWPRFHLPSRMKLRPQDRDYLLDLDAATTRS